MPASIGKFCCGVISFPYPSAITNTLVEDKTAVESTVAESGKTFPLFLPGITETVSFEDIIVFEGTDFLEQLIKKQMQQTAKRHFFILTFSIKYYAR